MQFVFQYDYSDLRDAVKQAKKMRHGSAFLWVIQHPRTRRYKVIEGEGVSDRPSRVPVHWEYVAPPPREPSEQEQDRERLIQMASESQPNSDGDELAQAVLTYLEKYQ